MSGKSVAFQKEVMNDSEDLQFFIRDLNQWETQIKKKDLELRQKANVHDSHEVSKVRDSNENASLSHSSTEQDQPVKKKKTVRIESTDFGEEKDCQNVDETSSSEDEEEESLELNRRKQQAVLVKDKGNEFLKCGKITEAIECYTRGCNLDPENALLPANRALAFLKQKQFGAAEKDCDTALQLDSTYVKAYQRRAAAREGLGNYEKAMEDFESVLKYEPRNKEAVSKLEQLKKLIKTKINSLATTSVTNEDPNGEIILPIVKPESLRSKDPLHRVKIVDTNVKNTNSNNKNVPKVPNLEAMSPTSIEKKPPSSLPKSPSSSFRFQVDFNQLKFFPDMQYLYFKSIPYNQLASLFKENLEPDVFSDIIKLVCEFYIKNGDEVYEILRQLTLTKRFSTLKMFLSNQDKDHLQKLFTYLRSKGNHQDYDIDDLVEAYGL